MSTNREHFTIIIRSEPGCRLPAVHRLRALLKACLRQYRFRALLVTPTEPPETNTRVSSTTNPEAQ